MLEPSEAALSFAREASLVAEEVVFVAKSSRSVFLLQPCNVIAKVTTPARRRSMEAELAICSQTQKAKGPVVPPLLRISPRPYVSEDWIATFWENCPSERSLQELEADALFAYLDLRPHLDSYEGELPSFSAPILRCGQDVAALSREKISAIQSASLERVLRSFEQMDWRSLETHVLHGDPHAENLTFSCREVLWLDLEAACVGPLEWDLTALPRRSHFEPPNPELKEYLDYVRSACVAIWCLQRPKLNRFEKDAVQIHLDRVARGPAA